jgi:hypothetical protein
MMKKRALMLAVAAAVLMPVLAWADSPAKEETYGKGVSLTETTSIKEILARPDDFVGKTVRIEGPVLDVCPMKGCWMELGTPQGDGTASLRVKVEDGVIAFPVTAKGKLAVAEGTVEAIPMTREKYVDWLAHLAEERGEKFDPSTVGEGPFRILQIQGTGARIEGL